MAGGFCTSPERATYLAIRGTRRRSVASWGALIGIRVRAGEPARKASRHTTARNALLRLTRDTILRLIATPNLEYKQLTAKIQDVA